jgi:hypothetical protein
MKSFLFAIAFFLLTGINAQNGQLEAKAAYLLAEEEFNNSKYTKSIQYLDEAIGKLGSPNAKILYLKILAESELSKTDTTYLVRVLRSIETFQTVPDYADFNEQKVLEITKLKYKVAEMREMELAKRKIELADDSAFQKVVIDNWRLGMSIEEAEQIDPDFFKKAKKGTYGTLIRYMGKQLIRTNSLNGRTNSRIFYSDFKDGKLAFLYKIWIIDKDDNFVKSNEMINSFRKALSFDPLITTSSNTQDWDKNSKMNIRFTSYLWKRGDKVIFIGLQTNHFFFKGKSYSYDSEIYLKIYDKSINKSYE